MTRTIPAEAGTDEQVGACAHDSAIWCAVGLAHAAIEAGSVRWCDSCQVAAVADVVELAGIANEEDTCNTWKLGRSDGRTASVYRLPAEVMA